MTIPSPAHRATILYFFLLLVFLAVSRSHQDAALPGYCAMRLLPRWLKEACEGRHSSRVTSSPRNNNMRRLPLTDPPHYGKRTWDTKKMKQSLSPLMDKEEVQAPIYNHIFSDDSHGTVSTRYVPVYISSPSSLSLSPSFSSTATSNQMRHRNRLANTQSKSFLKSKEIRSNNGELERIRRSSSMIELDAFTREAIKETIHRILRYSARRNERTGRRL